MRITVTDVNEPPAINGDATATFEELAGKIDIGLNAYTAVDPETNDSNGSTWSVAGADSSKFSIVDGELKFEAKPTTRCPRTPTRDNIYEVTVRAADVDGYIGTKAVKVTVTNEDEDGKVTLSKTRQRVGIAVTASVTDPDGNISGLTWQWSISSGAVTTIEGDIAGATSRHLHAEGGGRWRHADGNGELLRRAKSP